MPLAADVAPRAAAGTVRKWPAKLAKVRLFLADRQPRGPRAAVDTLGPRHSGDPHRPTRKVAGRPSADPSYGPLSDHKRMYGPVAEIGRSMAPSTPKRHSPAGGGDVPKKIAFWLTG